LLAFLVDFRFFPVLSGVGPSAGPKRFGFARELPHAELVRAQAVLGLERSRETAKRRQWIGEKASAGRYNPTED
jgi:hypothetical protein